MKKTVALIFLLFICTLAVSAQQITGTWNGDLDNDEFIQINIVQEGNTAYGYSWDYEYNNDSSFCKACFTGTYDDATSTWFLTGHNFLNNSGGHVLMDLKFKIKTEKGKLVMYGFCRTKAMLFVPAGDPVQILLSRVSKTASIPTYVRSCNPVKTPEKKKTADKPKAITKTPVVTKPNPPAPKKTAPKKDTPLKPRTIEKLKDTVPKIAAPPPVAKKPLLKEVIPATTAGRKNNESSHIIIHQKKITLSVYDNGEVDGDSVSIYYNGRLLMSHMRLSQKPIVVNVDLDENTTLHSFVLFAENLGTVPPNTALVIFNDAKGKRYELYTKSTLGENAQLVFEYVPE